MKKALFITSAFFFLIIVVCGGILIGYYVDDKKEEEKYQTVTEENYLAHNDDGVAFLRIDGLKIAYPVAQKDNEWYLTHNYFGEESEFGCLFLDEQNDLKNYAVKQNLVIYGHSMRTGAMFEPLKQYLYHYDDEEFLSENEVITLTIGQTQTKWKLFSVFYASSEENYIQTHFYDEEEYTAFLGNMYQKSMYKSTYDATKSILTLSSCNYNSQGDRRVVQFQLLD
ncbi:MAG: class B sortase [Clostridia bacterium]|nr:class B sortase [Clostridia bacterium]MBQ7913882.1 class B sortase [Clostridia bacterium]